MGGRGMNRSVCQFPPDCQPGVDTKGTLTYHTLITLKDGRVADSENTPMSQNVRYGRYAPPPGGGGWYVWNVRYDRLTPGVVRSEIYIFFVLTSLKILGLFGVVVGNGCR